MTISKSISFQGYYDQPVCSTNALQDSRKYHYGNNICLHACLNKCNLPSSIEQAIVIMQKNEYDCV